MNSKELMNLFEEIALNFAKVSNAFAEEEPVPDPEPEPDPEPVPVGEPLVPRVLDFDSQILLFPKTSLSRFQAYQRFTNLNLAKGMYTYEIRPVRGGRGPVSVWWAGERHVVRLESQVNSVELDTTKVPDGWHEIWAESQTPGEFIQPEWILVENGPNITIPEYIPVWEGSYDLTQIFQTPRNYADCLVPAEFDPPARPLEPRTYEYFDHPAEKSELYLSTLVAHQFGNIRRPNRDKEGRWSTAGGQSYYRHKQEERPTIQYYLDGPRGRGCIASATWFRPHGDSGAVDFAQASRVGLITEEGEVITLVGDRHKEPLYWGDRDGSELEVVGDWSQCEEPHWFNGCWSAPFDRRRIDDRAVIDGKERHVDSVIQFINDAHNNRILRVEYPNTHFPPEPNAGKVTVQECSLLLNDPWACDWCEHTNTLIIADRGNHRLISLDVDTGDAEIVLEGIALPLEGTQGLNVQPEILRRNDACYAPEGVRCQDAWVYFGSAGGVAIKRLNLDTGDLEEVLFLDPDQRKKSYIQLDVSDGTWGPRGMVVYADWVPRGYPRTAMEGGVPMNLHGNTIAGACGGPMPKGNGGCMSLGYTSAVGVGRGRCVFGASFEGVFEIRKTLPSDEPVDLNASTRGRFEWYDKGYNVAYGDLGWSWHQRPLPEDLSDDILAYLDSCSR